MPQLKPALLALTLLLGSGTVAYAQEAPQYRQVELLDGRVLVVQVLGTDDQGLLVDGRDGQMQLPWMDIINLEEVTEEAFIEAVTHRLVYVGTWVQEAGLEEDAQAIARRFEEAVASAPRMNLLREQELDAMLSSSDERRLAACEPSEVECVRPFVGSPDTQEYLYGVVEPLPGRMRVTMNRIDLKTGMKLESVPMAYEAQDPISNLSLYQSTWRLLGLDLDTLVSVPEDAPREGTPPADDPPKDSAIAAGTSAEGETLSSEQSDQAPDSASDAASTMESAAKAPLTQNRFIPLPGAPALAAGEARTFALATGVVGLITGATVYATGGVGLSVPWTVDQAPVSDPLFLGGVGTVTFVVSSLIANQVIVKITSKRSAASRVQVSPSPHGLAFHF